jgi:hypothetical protein
MTMPRLFHMVAIAACLGPLTSHAQGVPPSEEELAAQKTKAGVAGAVSTAMEVKSGVHHIPAITDAYTGNNYKGALGTYGTAVGVIGSAAQVTEGYYRGGRDGAVAAGMNVAVDWGVEWAASSAAAAYGLPAAPIVAAGAVGVYAGRAIDQKWGNDFANWSFGIYERNFLEPQREAQMQQLAAQHRERYAALRAQNASQPASNPAGSPEYVPQPSAADAFMNTVVQMQNQQQQQNAARQQALAQQQLQAQMQGLAQQQQQQMLLQQQMSQAPAPPPKASPPSPSPTSHEPVTGKASAMHKPDGFCSVPHMPGVCPGKK